MSSRSFGFEKPEHPHLVQPGKGGVGGEVGDLRRDVEDAFVALEAEVDAKVSVAPVRLATAAPLGACTAAGTGVGKTLTQNAAAIEDIDGTAVLKNDRILVRNQVTGKNNGIYTVTTVGTALVKQVLTRAADADSDAEVKCGLSVSVTAGSANAGTRWVLTTANPIVLDTDALTFTAEVPNIHHTRHENGGLDEISVAGLSGVLADPQNAIGHHLLHENGGGLDEISVTGLSGLLADGQTPLAHASSHYPSGTDPVAKSGRAAAGGAGDVAVVFGTAFANANYTVAITFEDTGGAALATGYIKNTTKVAAGFTIVASAAGIFHWIAIHD